MCIVPEILPSTNCLPRDEVLVKSSELSHHFTSMLADLNVARIITVAKWFETGGYIKIHPRFLRGYGSVSKPCTPVVHIKIAGHPSKNGINRY